VIVVGLARRIVKQLTKNMQHNTTQQPGGINSTVEINAWFVLSIEKLPMKVAVEQRVRVMTVPRTLTIK
jgi:hypothetical protein